MSPGALWAAWRGWVDRRESPASLAVVRVLVGIVVVGGLLEEARLGIAAPLRTAAAAGGLLAGPLLPEGAPGLGAVGPGALAWAFWGAQLTCGAGLLLGLAPRTSALCWVLLSAALGRALPQADRGVDMLLRNVILVLAASGAGGALALGRGGPVAVPAWPRMLLRMQLILVYAAAGWSKLASPWTPLGGWSALSLAAQDPAFSRLPAPLVVAAAPLTQAATALSWLWEWSAPTLALALYFRDTRCRPGRLRAAFNRLNVLWLSLGLGAAFHLGTHLSLRIGELPFVMIALYAAFVPPEAWPASLSRLPWRPR